MHGADVSQETRALRERVEELEEANRQLKDVLTPPLRFPAEWRLTPAEARGLASLYAATGGHRSKEALWIAVRVSDETNPDLVRPRISAIRRKLKGRGPDGIDIEIRTLWWEEGYHLPPESKAMITKAIEAP